MDPKWEEPALTMGRTIDEVAEVADRMASITGMLESIYTYMLQEGTTQADIKGLRTTLAEIHAEERGARKEKGPYDESMIRSTHVAAVVFRELGKFLELASQAFIVDYEVEYGGES